MSPAFVTEWLHLAVRWIHVITGIMWIGSSLFFNWLDAHIEQTERAKERGVEGDLWMVHSGGFYDVEKTLVAPKEMPKRLHWFKWEAGFTLLSGWLLLDIVFFQGGAVTLIDPNVSSLSPAGAIALTIAVLIGSWFVYDFLWRSPLTKNAYVGAALTFGLVLSVLFFFSSKLSGRASFLLTGAMMGTWMATNVWVHIIPAQKALVNAVTARKPPDERLAKHAKTRSRHNNYMTYPVVLIMVSNHFPGVYASKHAWIVLAGLMVIGAGIRHLQNRKKELSPGILLAVLLVLFVTTHSALTRDRSQGSAPQGGAPLTATVPSSTGGPEKVANDAVVGSVRGEVRLVGTPPPNKELNLGTCTTEAKGPVIDEAVLVNDGKLQNAFVWIKGNVGSYKPPAKTSKPVVIDQKACMYIPRVVGARVGQRVVFLNSDPVLHNVRSVAENNAMFNDMMPTKDTRLEKVFDKTEVPVRAKCDVHPWMNAFIGVVPHPFFAVSGPSGEFSLVNVPEGEHEIEVWHEVFGRQSQKVHVKAREAVELTLTFRTE